MGVLTVVKFGTTPARVPDEEIGELLKRADGDGIIRLQSRASVITARAAYAPGAPVQIASGPLRGFAGIYAGMDAADRERVLIELLGGTREVTVAAITPLH